ncbi:hypothetical protein K504DRAFT_369944 [Pleomassaria siparia CBS 279.74]|uniref:Uncharacterized protein n=1 Tax=Pleomassaria siparia CBS 279.74 TaxID=1314801 RepID=A0A6G1KL67_9PLEO|nr:hypothetical protein K504DRAFT_369944 [Pleomassaria siparia CBS 279.74]
MSSLLNRIRGPSSSTATQAPNVVQPRVQAPRRSSSAKRSTSDSDATDPNTPEKRLQLHQKGLYERVLPGKAFISAHVNRLQHGYYESSALHEKTSDHIYFVSVHFVFHPYDHRAHRFKRANIRVSIHGDDHSMEETKRDWRKPPRHSPRILQHAPELMYGAVSPENLQWNFSLSSSLGVSQLPLSATVNPSGGMTGRYRVFDMMSVQGSLRRLQSPMGAEYDVEDGMAVWSLEENLLQRSGLPREFDFVMLVHRPQSVKKMSLTVDVDAVVSGWVGEYPQWYTNLERYMPTLDATLDFNHDIGQRFLPVHPTKGFNFADLEHALEEYVMMPGTVYPTNDTKPDSNKGTKTFSVNSTSPDGKGIQTTPCSTRQPYTRTRDQQSTSGSYPNGSSQVNGRHNWAPETLNVRVLLEHNSPQPLSSRRLSGSGASNDATRQQSIRRRRSRSELKKYGAQQALHEIARDTLKGG